MPMYRRATTGSSTTTRRTARHAALLTGISMAALMASPQAEARPLGAWTPTPSAAAIAAAQAASQEAQRAAQSAQNALKRATLAIQAAQAAQQAARDAARAAVSLVPNGLAPGGLVPVANPNSTTDGLTTWIGAKAPTQSAANGMTDVKIEQTQSNAILSWQSFNVGKDTTLTFDQKGNAGWIALNRVVDPNAAPSQILGSIKADGTVLVINRNGIVFGGASQINVHSLVASTLDVGPRKATQIVNGTSQDRDTDISWRNENFLRNGLLGYSEEGPEYGKRSQFSALTGTTNAGTIDVAAGASIKTSGEGGLVLLTAPHVSNAGWISAPSGQVILAATATNLLLTPSTGEQTGIVPTVGAPFDPDVRGLVPFVEGLNNASGLYVWNRAGGLVEADRGNITLVSPGASYTSNFDLRGASYNDGILSSTTSVSRNGSIIIDGSDVRLGVGSLLAIRPDQGSETIPQTPSSLAAFKPSAIKIGGGARNIEMQESSFLYAPGANVQFGMLKPMGDSGFSLNQSILIQAGAEINVAGLIDVLVPATENMVVIDPAKKNELRDSPLYRDGFLNGATIYLDPRKSGVRDDGVAWIGSPLIDATAYYQLIGVSAERLMTKGGNVSFGPQSGTLNVFNNGATTRYDSPALVFRDGAIINMSGGWVIYQAGSIRETLLVRWDGSIVPISQATPDQVYVGVYNGWTRSNARWGITETWANPLRPDSRYEQEYTEGRDAGTLRAAGYAIVLDGTLLGQAHAGSRQLADSRTGTGKSPIAGDNRAVQGSFSELPAGGALIINSVANVNIAETVPAVPGNAYDDWTRGSIASSTGAYTPPSPATGLSVPAVRRETLYLTDSLLSKAGLSQVSLTTTGKVTVEEGASITLNAGGVFSVLAGRRIEINGDITARSGRVSLENGYMPTGTVDTRTASLGDFDIVINGDLSVAGRWVNDGGNFTDYTEGRAWLNGGSISIAAASKIRKFFDANGNPVSSATGTSGPSGPSLSYTAQDISGSILINGKLNLSGGGRVDRNGKLDLSARGGSLALTSNTAYYQMSDQAPSGFRVVSQANDDAGTNSVPINPDRINARILFDAASIQAHGFGGGGTFTLVTPEFAVGDSAATTGTIVPVDFFSSAGFATYDITSNKTEFSPSTFTNNFGGHNALLATQTITVGAGKTLSLVQSVLPNILSGTQYGALRGLASGGDVNSVVSAIVPAQAWDQRAVNLKLGGMLELHVEQGGRVVGAAGASLTVGGLLNEGTVRIAGGTITQSRTLSPLYTAGVGGVDAIGIRRLSDIFSIRPDGKIDPNAASAYNSAVTNQNLVGDFYPFGGTQGHGIYKLGVLDQGQGIVLAEGSVTDLSGAVIVNPYAIGPRGQSITTGAIIGGGTLQTRSIQRIESSLTSPYQVSGTIVARPGARLDLSGVSGVFDLPGRRTGIASGGYVATPVWSDAGSLIVGAGSIFTGADIRAQGGSAQATGGTLQILNPIFAQHDPASPTLNMVSADMIARSGFDTLVALGTITAQGDATVGLGRAFLLQSRPWDAVNGPSAPVISTGGALTIEAPYIGLQSVMDQAAPATTGAAGSGSVTFRGRHIDVVGAALFDRSVSRAIFDASGDIRLIGVAPWRAATSATAAAATLNGMIAVNGDLTMIAGQIYPTTGSSFVITSTAANGTITFGRSGANLPATPYSAGGSLTVQAANIVQGGVIRVPFGTLTLGGNSAYVKAINNVATTYAPATQSVTLADGSVTSVSANGLSIPYGTTTDTKEWYFAPTSTDRLSDPPVKVLSLNGSSITLGAGATIDVSGGGDVYAYEFVPGTGGSRDVLDRFNADQYSANVINGVGYQYPNARQIYAIVPGLSDAPAAAFDPIYSADYADLQSASGVGKRVWLDAAPGLAAGWYTLLPAKYAMLPGGMRVVEQTGAKTVLPGSSLRQPDGSLLVPGRYGDALSGAEQSQVRLFSVQSQSVIRSYSNIVLTSGNLLALTKATNADEVAPRTGLDAGRLVLNPLAALSVNAILQTAAASGGRGAQVDITGAKIDILSDLSNAPADGAIHLVAGDLNKLNAGSLLIGGIRTDNADGTTSLAVTARSIRVANDAAHPLVAPEIVLAVDDGVSGTVASSLTLDDGATIIATGILSDNRNGAYVIDGRIITSVNSSNQTVYTAPAQSAIGALLRIANGPERLVRRLRTPTSSTNPGSPAGPAASLIIGNADLRGDAIGLDTSHNASIASGAQLHGKNVAFGAGALAFTTGSVPVGTVVITPQLQAILSQGVHLTLRSQTTIGFDNGNYSFGATTLDAATLLSLEGGTVNLNASQLQLSNAGAAGTAAGGTGALTIVADELSMGNGAIATSGFGSVSLTAAKGTFSDGANGVLDVGSANLTLITPYIGDRAQAGVAPKSSTGMTLKSAGVVAIANAGTTPLDLASLGGIPGSSLTIEGNGVTIAGTHLRATSGSLSIKSSGGIALSGGAVLEVPGYEKTFGDAADPQTVAAPGGNLVLAAAGTSGIALGDATLSVGGGTGNGGGLTLSTPNGAVDWGSAVLIGKGGTGNQGGTFSIDTNGAIDLVSMNDRVVANGFTSGFNVRTRTGDIVLGAGQVLRSGSVNLTADGGFVTIAGTIDTSGTNGGDIELYGRSGVTLQSTARLDSHAQGYAADDSRKAKAGDITLGTDFLLGHGTIQTDGSISGTTADSGKITVASGAVIDASAQRPGNRLVRLMRDGVVNYVYVEGDEGGIVRFRAPVVNDGNGHSSVYVEVASAGSIKGAKAIDLEGFKRWDLKTVAQSGLYSGVAYNAQSNTITLDVRTGLDTANTDGSLTTVAGLNFLGDKGTGTVVEFVQNFDVSAVYDKLGGLASQANFSARPGVELKHDGNITLASNWNLGAGTVNVDAAKAAELMAVDTVSQQDYVKPGGVVSGIVMSAMEVEAELLAHYTTMTYRVGGRATGAAPVISLRAAGDLHLTGSLTDGFFQFRDQYDPTYQSYLRGRPGGTTVFTLKTGGTDGTYFADYQTYLDNPLDYNDPECNWSCNVAVLYSALTNTRTQGGGGGPVPIPKIPFSALGNSPAALTKGANGPSDIGDPLASAVVFPLLPGGQIVGSSDYRLAAGAAIGSVDPLRIASAATGNMIVDGPKPMTMSVVPAMVGAGGQFLIELTSWGQVLGTQPFRAGQPGFLAYLRGLISGLNDDAALTLQYSGDIPASLQAFMDQARAADPAAHVSVWTHTDWVYPGVTEITMSAALFSEFVRLNPNGFGGPAAVQVKLLPQTVIRTGIGSIRTAAAGSVDLTGGSTRYLNDDGTVSDTLTVGQLGGAAIYTAGRRAAAISEVLADPVTGVAVNVSSAIPRTTVFSAPPAFDYGTPLQDQPLDPVGIVIADALQLRDGGKVEITAGNDVLGRRDLSLSRLRTAGGSVREYAWAGRTGIGSTGVTMDYLADDQAWRVGSVGFDATTASINPQLFREGLGALGGGDITVRAGGKISDIAAISDTSLLTGTATRADSTATKVLMTLGGGNVKLSAQGDILAARIDAPSGTATLSAGGRIGGLKVQTGTNTFQYRGPDNIPRSIIVPVLLDSETVLRINDATVSLTAGLDIAMQGIRQLDGFYSDHSALNLVSNGLIDVSNLAPQAPSFLGNTSAGTSGRLASYAIYPGTLTVASLMGDANLRTITTPPRYVPPNGDWTRAPAGYNGASPSAILLVPSPVGQLSILAGGDIMPTKISMLDADPYNLPGLFTRGGKIITTSNFSASTGGDATYQFAFPRVLSSTNQAQLELQHNQATTHAGDPLPAYIYADGDIGTEGNGVTLSLPKQARIYAGRDIINMMFFGQNVRAGDLTRIVAGRDLIGTSTLQAAQLHACCTFGNLQFTTGPLQPVMLGNSFILGGPGDLVVEAGRDMGPFLNSAEIKDWNVEVTGAYPYRTNGLTALPNVAMLRFGEGIITVGNDWNPYLPKQGANITALFGVGKGADYAALREAYVAPGSAPNALGGYGVKLVAWMQKNAADRLQAKFGTTDVTGEQAYDAFLSLAQIRQRLFLNQVYFDELRAPSVKDGPSYLKYSRGYAAVNTLFPASLGYTANGLEGGANDGVTVRTGDLDLRLAAIETVNGGDITILGPGGRVLAGSVVSTAQQAARRNYVGFALHSPPHDNRGIGRAETAPIEAIPPGYEGVITQRGGAINTFTDGDFLLNQSRLFTVKGGDITMWSSNADLNAGQGAKTTPNFPPVAIKIGKNAYVEVDQPGATSGAGIAALPPGAGIEPPNVYLLAPRGTVDAGDAGVRAANEISVAALRVVNADNFKAGGTMTGIPTVQAPNIGGLTEASNSAGAAAQQAATPSQGSGNTQPSVIIVEVLGFGGGDGNERAPNDEERERQRGSGDQRTYNTNSPYQVLGVGVLTDDQVSRLAAERRASIGSR